MSFPNQIHYGIIISVNPLKKRILLVFTLLLANAINEISSFGLRSPGSPTESCLASRAAQTSCSDLLSTTKFKFYHHVLAETLLLSGWWRRVKASQVWREADAVAIPRLLYTLQSAYWQLLLPGFQQIDWEIHFNAAQCHCHSTCASINVTSPRGVTHKDKVRHESLNPPTLWLPPTLMG